MASRADLADTVRRYGMSPGASKHRELTESITDALRARLGVEAEGQVSGIKVVVADDIADWFWDDTYAGTDFDQLGNITPPWPLTWIEYHSQSRRQRRAIVVTSEHLDRLDDARQAGTEGSLYERALADARTNGNDTTGPGWAVACSVIKSAGRRVVGPLGGVLLLLGDDGRMVGNGWWLDADLDRAYLREGRPIQEGDHEAVVLSWCGPALLTLSLFHLRNVEADEVVPAVTPRHRRRGNLPPVRHYRLRVKLPRRANQGGSKSGAGWGVGMHVVAGHVAHYGDCCPGVHKPNGKMFGRLEGRYWVPAHMRGDPVHGVATSEMEALRG